MFSGKIKKKKNPSSIFLPPPLSHKDLRFQPSSTTFPKCLLSFAKETALVGLYWLPVNRLISIILKAFEPIAPLVACKQEDGDIPEVRKQLRLKERLLLGRRFGLGLLIKWLQHSSDSHSSV